VGRGALADGNCSKSLTTLKWTAFAPSKREAIDSNLRIEEASLVPHRRPSHCETVRFSHYLRLPRVNNSSPFLALNKSSLCHCARMIPSAACEFVPSSSEQSHGPSHARVLGRRPRQC